MKLRKIRWRIYRDIDLTRGNIVKSLKYYKRQVRLFLKDFANNLKPEEPSIWNAKVSKTSDDVYASKRNKKKVHVCASCSTKFIVSNGESLPSLSAAHHFVRANKAALNEVEKVNEKNLDAKSMSAEVEAEHYDVVIDEEVSGDDIVATAQRESRLAEFWEYGSTNPVPADQAEELLKVISREASSHEFKKGYMMMNEMKADERTADDENDESTAAVTTTKEVITASSSKLRLFKPVDWSKCLK